MKKKTVAVFLGGPSVEHEISLVSSKSIIKNIDTTKFNILPIYITKKGKWHFINLISFLNDDDHFYSSETQVIPELTLTPSGKLLEIKEDKILNRFETDVAFPILHGTYGEDGSIQGCFELMGIPYVGADVLGSSIGMDKVVMNEILRDNKLPVVDFFGFTKSEWESKKNEIINRIKAEIDYPCFVKSADLGSSVGISKVDSEELIYNAIESSLKYSNKVLVEQAVINPREVEVSVLGNENPVASLPGEIIPKKDFYDYEAKYHDDSTELKIPAELSPLMIDELKDLAVKTFTSLCCSGMGRIDFLINSNNEDIFVSEINTIPGFTSISMYPKLWEVSGIPYRELLTKLIDLAEEKFNSKKTVKTDLMG